MFPALLQHVQRLPIRQVYLSQLYFSGVQSVGVALLAGGALGAIIVSLILGSFGQSSAMALRIMSISTLEEAAPIMVGLLFAARSGAAQATELATMRVTGELRTLQRLGIDPIEYLVWPRVLAASMCCAALYLYFVASAMLIGAAMTPQAGMLTELRALAANTETHLPFYGMAKTAIFGMAVSSIACQLGFSAGSASTEIARLASRTVLYSVISILLLDVLFGVLLRLWT
ncbi:ABC transporter permease [Permianibacter sp. IMCC34836]|uniref:ABC transporter permease n=1 Tax=Permianibacter fluminis TaxID=2738515 RepID=UPI001552413D|nr:ABC transporter permease [Permianibacter fluminis]NQD35467.1 ABC transporter permease [Permianibacter fluminis]